MGPAVTAIIDRLRRFLREARGAATVEMLFALIITNMALVGFSVWWDAYRAQARVERTAYTLSDLITRQRGNTLTRPFLDGLERTAEFLLRPEQDAAIRFTQVTRQSGTHPGLTGLVINWSYSPCGRFLPAANDPAFSLANVPMLNVGATVIIVEMRVPFSPQNRFEVLSGLDDEIFYRRISAMPRFETQPFQVPASPSGTTTCIN